MSECFHTSCKVLQLFMQKMSSYLKKNLFAYKFGMQCISLFWYLQVAFNYFYNTSAHCMQIEPTSTVEMLNLMLRITFLCASIFLTMEIKSRVVAATLDFMQITSLDDTTSEDVCCHPCILHQHLYNRSSSKMWQLKS